MSKSYTIGRVILTVLLSFFMAGYIFSSSADAMLSLPRIYTDIIEEEKLADKAYEALDSDFASFYNTTAIPKEVCMDAISTEWLLENMCKSIEGNIEILNGADTLVEIDFTALEESITAFFHEYAESIDYEPDEAFEKKLSETIINAEKIITDRMDAFYMNALHENGYFNKIAKLMPYINIVNWVTFGGSMILMTVLVLLDRNRGWRRLYWAGTGLFCGGAMAAVPVVYILCTGMIDSFSVKDPIIYTAVTGLLNAGAWRVLFKSMFFGILGLVLIVLNVVFNKNTGEEK
ncbi:MAG: hypothetical protein ACI4JN_08285 [Ruminococcus sp.]